MAAVVAARNQGRNASGRLRTKSEGNVDLAKVLPSDKTWKGETLVEIMLNRCDLLPCMLKLSFPVTDYFASSKSNPRRIVYTKDEIFICFVGEDIVRDVIPLSEVESVIESQEWAESLTISSFSKRTGLKQTPSNSSSKSMSSIIISTLLSGYNSGRKYYLKPQSDEVCSALVKDWRLLVQEATEKARGQVIFRNSQNVLKRFLNSNPIQGLAAFMIFSVSCAPQYSS
jgi:hypothetical protein